MKPNGYNQVCLIAGIIPPKNEEEIKKFETLIFDKFKTRIKYIDYMLTKPDTDSDGNNVPNTGGRLDVLFYVHDEDISIFAVPRFSIRARWIEDVLADMNYRCKIYPDSIYQYVTWNKEYISFFNNEQQTEQEI